MIRSKFVACFVVAAVLAFTASFSIADTILTTNYRSDTVSVIDTTTNTVIATVYDVGGDPLYVAARLQGDYAYVTNYSPEPPPFDPPSGVGSGSTVTVISTPTLATAAVYGTIIVGSAPAGIAILSDGSVAFVANRLSNSISVIDTDPASINFNTVISTISLQPTYVGPFHIVFNASETIAYVVCAGSQSPPEAGSIAAIDTAAYTQLAAPNSIPSGSIQYNTNFMTEMDILGTTGFITLFSAATNNARVLQADLTAGTVASGLTYGGITFTGTSGVTVAPSNSEIYVTRMMDSVEDSSGYDGTGTDGDYVEVLNSSGVSLGPIYLGDGCFDPRQVVFSGNFAYIALFGENDTTPVQTEVAVIDVLNRQVLSSIAVGTSPYGMCVIPDAAPVALNIITTSLDDAEEGQFYSAFLVVVGGTLPYTFSYTGTLPPGLQLDSSTGQIYGTPSDQDTYSIVVTVTDGASDTDSQSFEITITPPINPQINLVPDYFTFSANEGASSVASQKLYISNVGTGIVSWTVSDDAPWLSVSPISGASTGESDEVTVSVDISTLPIGVYTGSISVTDPDAVNSPQIASVTLTVIAAGTPPSIGVSPSSFNFYAAEGLANPATQVMKISNKGAGTLSWNIVDNVGWLTMDPPAGSSIGESDEVVLAVSISGKASGPYVGTITITATGADNSPLIVPVNLTVEVPQPVINNYPTNLYFVAVKDGDLPDYQTLTIWNSKVVPLDWEVTTNQDWLTVSPSSGIGAKDEETYLKIYVNQFGLDKGIYDAIISIKDPDAINSPQYAFVKLTVAFESDLLKTPSLVAPSDYATTTDSTPTFTWSEAIYTQGSVTYVFQLDDDSAFATPLIYVSGLDSLTYTAQSVIPNGVYYWRVKAITSGQLMGDWTSVYSVVIDIPIPEDPGGGGGDIIDGGSGDGGGGGGTGGGTTQPIVPPASNTGGCFLQSLLK